MNEDAAKTSTTDSKEAPEQPQLKFSHYLTGIEALNDAAPCFRPKKGMKKKPIVDCENVMRAKILLQFTNINMEDLNKYYYGYRDKYTQPRVDIDLKKYPTLNREGLEFTYNLQWFDLVAQTVEQTGIERKQIAAQRDQQSQEALQAQQRNAAWQSLGNTLGALQQIQMNNRVRQLENKSCQHNGPGISSPCW